MAENRQYDHEYIVQAVKLAKEIGQARAAQEPGAPGMPCMAGRREAVKNLVSMGK